MSSLSSKIFKSISAFLVVSLALEPLAFAAPDVVKADLGSWIADRGENHKSWARSVLPEIPFSVATIEDAWHAPDGAGSPIADLGSRINPPSVILIQDAHTNDSGQLNIARLLDILFQDRGSRIADRDSSAIRDPKSAIQYIFLEAGAGDDSLSFLRKYASPEKRKQIAESFLRQGKLKGAEYFDLATNHKLVLWGVEDFSLYAQSIAAYRYVAKEREKLQDYLAEIDSTIKTLKPRIFNPFLSAFDEKYSQYVKEKLSLTDYFTLLSEQARIFKISLDKYPHFQALKDLKEFESKIDFKAANEEEQKAIESLSEEDQKELAGAGFKPAPTSRDPKIQGAFFALLEEKIRRGGFQTRPYPELFKYFDYLKQASAIEPKALLDEQKSLEDAVFKALTNNSDEENLLKASKSLEFLKKIFNLTITPEEYDAYRRHKEDFDVVKMTGFLNKKIMEMKQYYEKAVFLKTGYEEAIRHCEEFYSLTYQRDQKFIENMLKKLDEEAVGAAGGDAEEGSRGRGAARGGEHTQDTEAAGPAAQQTAVLITGGYHTADLKNILKKRNISFISLTPQILHETNQKRYERELFSTTFDQYLNQVIAPKPTPNAATHTIGEPVAVLGNDGAALVGDITTDKSALDEWQKKADSAFQAAIESMNRTPFGGPSFGAGVLEGQTRVRPSKQESGEGQTLVRPPAARLARSTRPPAAGLLRASPFDKLRASDEGPVTSPEQGPELVEGPRRGARLAQNLTLDELKLILPFNIQLAIDSAKAKQEYVELDFNGWSERFSPFENLLADKISNSILREVNLQEKPFYYDIERQDNKLRIDFYLARAGGQTLRSVVVVHSRRSPFGEIPRKISIGLGEAIGLDDGDYSEIEIELERVRRKGSNLQLKYFVRIGYQGHGDLDLDIDKERKIQAFTQSLMNYDETKALLRWLEKQSSWTKTAIETAVPSKTEGRIEGLAAKNAARLAAPADEPASGGLAENSVTDLEKIKAYMRIAKNEWNEARRLLDGPELKLVAEIFGGYYNFSLALNLLESAEELSLIKDELLAHLNEAEKDIQGLLREVYAPYLEGIENDLFNAKNRVILREVQNAIQILKGQSTAARLALSGAEGGVEGLALPAASAPKKAARVMREITLEAEGLKEKKLPYVNLAEGDKNVLFGYMTTANSWTQALGQLKQNQSALLRNKEGKLDKDQVRATSAFFRASKAAAAYGYTPRQRKIIRFTLLYHPDYLANAARQVAWWDFAHDKPKDDDTDDKVRARREGYVRKAEQALREALAEDELSGARLAVKVTDEMKNKAAELISSYKNMRKAGASDELLLSSIEVLLRPALLKQSFDKSELDNWEAQTLGDGLSYFIKSSLQATLRAYILGSIFRRALRMNQESAAANPLNVNDNYLLLIQTATELRDLLKEVTTAARLALRRGQPSADLAQGKRRVERAVPSEAEGRVEGLAKANGARLAGLQLALFETINTSRGGSNQGQTLAVGTRLGSDPGLTLDQSPAARLAASADESASGGLAAEDADEPIYPAFTVSDLIKKLDSPYPSIRQYAAEGLAYKGADAAEAIPALERAASQDPHEYVRAVAAEAIEEIKQDLLAGEIQQTQIQRWIQILQKDKNAHHRQGAIGALPRFFNPKTKDTIIPAITGALLKDKSPRVRQSAAWFFYLKEPQEAALPALMEALSKDKNEDVRSGAAMAIGRFSSEAKNAVLLLEKVAKQDRAPSVRAHARQALRNIGVSAGTSSPDGARLAEGRTKSVPVESFYIFGGNKVVQFSIDDVTYTVRTVFMGSSGQADITYLKHVERKGWKGWLNWLARRIEKSGSIPGRDVWLDKNTIDFDHFDQDRPDNLSIRVKIPDNAVDGDKEKIEVTYEWSPNVILSPPFAKGSAARLARSTRPPAAGLLRASGERAVLSKAEQSRGRVEGLATQPAARLAEPDKFDLEMAEWGILTRPDAHRSFVLIDRTQLEAVLGFVFPPMEVLRLARMVLALAGLDRREEGARLAAVTDTAGFAFAHLANLIEDGDVISFKKTDRGRDFEFETRNGVYAVSHQVRDGGPDLLIVEKRDEGRRIFSKDTVPLGEYEETVGLLDVSEKEWATRQPARRPAETLTPDQFLERVRSGKITNGTSLAITFDRITSHSVRFLRLDNLDHPTEIFYFQSSWEVKKPFSSIKSVTLVVKEPAGLLFSFGIPPDSFAARLAARDTFEFIRKTHALDYSAKGGKLTVEGILAAGQDLSRRTIQEHLRQLVAEGFLVDEGETGGARQYGYRHYLHRRESGDDTVYEQYYPSLDVQRAPFLTPGDPYFYGARLAEQDSIDVNEFIKLLGDALAREGEGIEIKLRNNIEAIIDEDFVKAHREKIIEGVKSLLRTQLLTMTQQGGQLSYVQLAGQPDYHIEQRDALLLIAIGKVLGFWSIFPDLNDRDPDNLERSAHAYSQDRMGLLPAIKDVKWAELGLFPKGTRLVEAEKIADVLFTSVLNKKISDHDLVGTTKDLISSLENADKHNVLRSLAALNLKAALIARKQIHQLYRSSQRRALVRSTILESIAAARLALSESAEGRRVEGLAKETGEELDLQFGVDRKTLDNLIARLKGGSILDVKSELYGRLMRALQAAQNGFIKVNYFTALLYIADAATFMRFEHPDSSLTKELLDLESSLRANIENVFAARLASIVKIAEDLEVTTRTNMNILKMLVPDQISKQRNVYYNYHRYLLDIEKIIGSFLSKVEMDWNRKIRQASLGDLANFVIALRKCFDDFYKRNSRRLNRLGGGTYGFEELQRSIRDLFDAVKIPLDGARLALQRADLKTFFENELVPAFRQLKGRPFELKGNVLAQSVGQDGSDTTLSVKSIDDDALRFETRHWYGDEDVLGRDVYAMSFGPSRVAIEKSDAYQTGKNGTIINEPDAFRGFGHDKKGNIYLLVSDSFYRKYEEAKASSKNPFLTQPHLFYFKIVSEEAVPNNLSGVHKVSGARLAGSQLALFETINTSRGGSNEGQTLAVGTRLGSDPRLTLDQTLDQSPAARLALRRDASRADLRFIIMKEGFETARDLLRNGPKLILVRTENLRNVLILEFEDVIKRLDALKGDDVTARLDLADRVDGLNQSLESANVQEDLADMVGAANKDEFLLNFHTRAMWMLGSFLIVPALIEWAEYIFDNPKDDVQLQRARWYVGWTLEQYLTHVHEETMALAAKVALDYPEHFDFRDRGRAKTILSELMALGEGEPPATAIAAAAILSHRDEFDVITQSQARSILGGARLASVSDLLAQLSDRDRFVREEAALKLSELPPAQVMPALLEKITNGTNHRPEKLSAILALGWIRSITAAALSRMVSDLADLIKRERDGEIVNYAAWAISRVGSAAKGALTVLAHREKFEKGRPDVHRSLKAAMQRIKESQTAARLAASANESASGGLAGATVIERGSLETVKERLTELLSERDDWERITPGTFSLKIVDLKKEADRSGKTLPQIAVERVESKLNEYPRVKTLSDIYEIYETVVHTGVDKQEKRISVQPAYFYPEISSFEIKDSPKRIAVLPSVGGAVPTSISVEFDKVGQFGLELKENPHPDAKTGSSTVSYALSHDNESIGDLTAYLDKKGILRRVAHPVYRAEFYSADFSFETWLDSRIDKPWTVESLTSATRPQPPISSAEGGKGARLAPRLGAEGASLGTAAALSKGREAPRVGGARLAEIERISDRLLAASAGARLANWESGRIERTFVGRDEIWSRIDEIRATPQGKKASRITINGFVVDNAELPALRKGKSVKDVLVGIVKSRAANMTAVERQRFKLDIDSPSLFENGVYEISILSFAGPTQFQGTEIFVQFVRSFTAENILNDLLQTADEIEDLARRFDEKRREAERYNVLERAAFIKGLKAKYAEKQMALAIDFVRRLNEYPDFGKNENLAKLSEAIRQNSTRSRTNGENPAYFARFQSALKTVGPLYREAVRQGRRLANDSAFTTHFEYLRNVSVAARLARSTRPPAAGLLRASPFDRLRASPFDKLRAGGEGPVTSPEQGPELVEGPRRGARLALNETERKALENLGKAAEKVAVAYQAREERLAAFRSAKDKAEQIKLFSGLKTSQAYLSSTEMEFMRSLKAGDVSVAVLRQLIETLSNKEAGSQDAASEYAVKLIQERLTALLKKIAQEDLMGEYTLPFGKVANGTEIDAARLAGSQLALFETINTSRGGSNEGQTLAVGTRLGSDPRLTLDQTLDQSPAARLATLLQFADPEPRIYENSHENIHENVQWVNPREPVIYITANFVEAPNNVKLRAHVNSGNHSSDVRWGSIVDSFDYGKTYRFKIVLPKEIAALEKPLNYSLSISPDGGRTWQSDGRTIQVRWSSEGARLAVSAPRAREDFAEIISNLMGGRKAELASLVDQYRNAANDDEKKRAETAINQIVDEINVLKPEPGRRLEDIELADEKHTRYLEDFMQISKYADYERQAEERLLNGEYVPEFIFGGAATRLLQDLETVVGHRLNPRDYRMYGLDLWEVLELARSADEKILAKVLGSQERARQLKALKVSDKTHFLGMGPRQLVAYLDLLETLSKKHKRDLEEVMKRQKIIVHVNEETTELILQDFELSSFYDFERSNVYFIIQPTFRGYSLRADGSVAENAESAALPYGHGYATSQLKYPDAFTLDDRGDPKRLSASVLDSLIAQDKSDRFLLGTHRINDSTKFLTGKVVDLPSLALGIYLISEGHGIVKTLVGNPTGQKGGNDVHYRGEDRTFLLETSNAKGSAHLNALLEKAARERAPYNAFRLLTTPRRYRGLLDKGLTYNLRFKSGDFYLESVTGDLTQMPESNSVSIAQRGEVIHDFKQLSNLGETLTEFVAKQDAKFPPAESNDAARSHHLFGRHSATDPEGIEQTGGGARLAASADESASGGLAEIGPAINQLREIIRDYRLTALPEEQEKKYGGYQSFFENTQITLESYFISKEKSLEKLQEAVTWILKNASNQNTKLVDETGLPEVDKLFEVLSSLKEALAEGGYFGQEAPTTPEQGPELVEGPRRGTRLALRRVEGAVLSKAEQSRGRVEGLATQTAARLAASADESASGGLAVEKIDPKNLYFPKPSESAEAYAKVTETKWYQTNLGHSLEPVLARLNENSVVVSLSEGTGATSLYLLRRLKEEGRKIRKLVVTDIGTDNGRGFLSKAVQDLEEYRGVGVAEIEYYVQLRDETTRTFGRISEIPGLEGAADEVIFMNAVHLLSAAQRASTFEDARVILRPGGHFTVGSGNVQKSGFDDHALVDTFFHKTHAKAAELAAKDERFSDVSQEVLAFPKEEADKKRARFLRPPIGAPEIIRELEEAAFYADKKFEETPIDREEYRNFIIGVEDYVKMNFPELAALPADRRQEIFQEAYDAVFPVQGATLRWTNFEARKPTREEVRAALAKISDRGVRQFAENLTKNGTLGNGDDYYFLLRLRNALGTSASASAFRSLFEEAGIFSGAAARLALSDPERSRGGVEGLAETEAQVDRLVAQLSSSKSETRATAIYKLGLIGPTAEPALPNLLRMLRDSNHIVRAFAARAIGRIGRGTQNTFRALSDALEDKDILVRSAAAYAIGLTSSTMRAGGYVLANLLSDEDSYVRVSAAQALEVLAKKVDWSDRKELRRYLRDRLKQETDPSVWDGIFSVIEATHAARLAKGIPAEKLGDSLNQAVQENFGSLPESAVVQIDFKGNDLATIVLCPRPSNQASAIWPIDVVRNHGEQIVQTITGQKDSGWDPKADYKISASIIGDRGILYITKVERRPPQNAADSSASRGARLAAIQPLDGDKKNGLYWNYRVEKDTLFFEIIGQIIEDRNQSPFSVSWPSPENKHPRQKNVNDLDSKELNQIIKKGSLVTASFEPRALSSESVEEVHHVSEFLVQEINLGNPYGARLAAQTKPVDQMSNKEKIGLYVKLLKSDSAGTRARAADNLGVMGKKAKDAVSALAKALKDSDEDVRKSAETALEHIAGSQGARLAKSGALFSLPGFDLPEADRLLLFYFLAQRRMNRGLDDRFSQESLEESLRDPGFIPQLIRDHYLWDAPGSTINGYHIGVWLEEAMRVSPYPYIKIVDTSRLEWNDKHALETSGYVGGMPATFEFTATGLKRLRELKEVEEFKRSKEQRNTTAARLAQAWTPSSITQHLSYNIEEELTRRGVSVKLIQEINKASYERNEEGYSKAEAIITKSIFSELTSHPPLMVFHSHTGRLYLLKVSGNVLEPIGHKKFGEIGNFPWGAPGESMIRHFDIYSSPFGPRLLVIGKDLTVAGQTPQTHGLDLLIINALTGERISPAHIQKGSLLTQPIIQVDEEKGLIRIQDLAGDFKLISLKYGEEVNPSQPPAARLALSESAKGRRVEGLAASADKPASDGLAEIMKLVDGIKKLSSKFERKLNSFVRDWSWWDFDHSPFAGLRRELVDVRLFAQRLESKLKENMLTVDEVEELRMQIRTQLIERHGYDYVDDGPTIAGLGAYRLEAQEINIPLRGLIRILDVLDRRLGLLKVQLNAARLATAKELNLDGARLALSAEELAVPPTIDILAQRITPVAGAVTGQLNLETAVKAGATGVIVGHSETRPLSPTSINDTNEEIAAQFAAALKNPQIKKIILAVGETADEKEGGVRDEVLHIQLQSVLGSLAEAEKALLKGRLVIAYEPRWAIAGSGGQAAGVATPEYAAAAHAQIKKVLDELLGQGLAASVPVIYGGSVTAKDAETLLRQETIGGFLVGGASKSVESFLPIVQAAEKVARETGRKFYIAGNQKTYPVSNSAPQFAEAFSKVDKNLVQLGLAPQATEISDFRRAFTPLVLNKLNEVEVRLKAMQAERLELRIEPTPGAARLAGRGLPDVSLVGNPVDIEVLLKQAAPARLADRVRAAPAIKTEETSPEILKSVARPSLLIDRLRFKPKFVGGDGASLKLEKGKIAFIARVFIATKGAAVGRRKLPIENERRIIEVYEIGLNAATGELVISSAGATETLLPAEFRELAHSERQSTAGASNVLADYQLAIGRVKMAAADADVAEASAKPVIEGFDLTGFPEDPNDFRLQLNTIAAGISWQAARLAGDNTRYMFTGDRADEATAYMAANYPNLKPYFGTKEKFGPRFQNATVIAVVVEGRPIVSREGVRYFNLAKFEPNSLLNPGIVIAAYHMGAADLDVNKPSWRRAKGLYVAVLGHDAPDDALQLATLGQANPQQLKLILIRCVPVAGAMIQAARLAQAMISRSA